jgi:hypothetical protein
MTDKSRREIEQRIKKLHTESITFREYYEFSCRRINTEGSGPTEKEFFGRELTPSEQTKFWHKMRAVWDGEKQPPTEEA